jgi:CheY-like chemotaxis protein
MSDTPRQYVLLVDDDSRIRETMALLLHEEGYEVATAVHGLDALRQLRLATPQVIISDLNMPQMSGFELLSVVRLRFPSIPVIAMSGAYASSDCFPGGVMADAFYPKGGWQTEELLRAVTALTQAPVVRAASHQCLPAPLQIPRAGRDSQGLPFILLTCPDCLRSFPLNAPPDNRQEVSEAHCQFCATSVRYVSDCSRPITPRRAPGARQAVTASAS